MKRNGWHGPKKLVVHPKSAPTRGYWRLLADDDEAVASATARHQREVVKDDED